MNNIELYIQNTEGDYVSIDIFDNENIQIEDSIQDVKDISKIFNTFSRDFKVPASFENNKLFKHYYNLNIDNGFDGRIKTKALIKVGGVDYKEGYLRLLNVGLRDNKPNFYKVTFQGLITSLKDVLEDNELKDLDYSSLQFDNSVDNKAEAIRQGLYRNGSPEEDDNGNDLYPDLIYAPIFTKGKVVAVPQWGLINTSNDSSYPNHTLNFSLAKFTGIGNTNTLVQDDSSPYRQEPVVLADYKPSIKLGLLIKMIGQQYNLNFAKDFYQLEELDQMYVHFNGKKEESNIESSSNAFNSNLGNNTSLDVNTTNIIEYNTEDTPLDGVISLLLPNGFSDWSKRYTVDGANNGQTEESYYQVYYTNGSFRVEWDVLGGSVPPISFTTQKYFRDADGEKVILQSRSYNQAVINYSGVMSTGTNLDGSSPYANEVYYYNNVPHNTPIECAVIIESNDDISSLSIGMQYNKADVQRSGNVISPRFYTTGSYDGLMTPLTNDAAALGMIDVVTSAYMNISVNAPKLKLIDLLLGVFKMLNLTSYVELDGTIKVLPLRDYYAAGNTINITQHVEVYSHTVENGFVYRNVTMKHDEAEDVLSKNFVSSEKGVKYGDIRITENNLLGDDIIQDNNGIVDGKDYQIESPFQRMMFENLALNIDDNGNTLSGNYSASIGGRLTDMVIGNAIDDTLEGIETKPIIFYGKRVDMLSSYSPSMPNPTDITMIGGRIDNVTKTTERGNTAGSTGYRYIIAQTGATSTNNSELVSDDTLASSGNAGLGSYNASYWWNPSGIMASRYRRDGSLINPYAKFNSVSFDGGQAFDEAEYTNGLPSQDWIVGLYQNNYKDYLENLYEKTSRIS